MDKRPGALPGFFFSLPPAMTPTNKAASVLRDTGVDTLQPDYLRSQIQYKLRLDADTCNKVMDEFLGKEKNRLSKITGSLDKDAAAQPLLHPVIPLPCARPFVIILSVRGRSVVARS